MRVKDGKNDSKNTGFVRRLVRWLNRAVIVFVLSYAVVAAIVVVEGLHVAVTGDRVGFIIIGLVSQIAVFFIVRTVYLVRVGREKDSDLALSVLAVLPLILVFIPMLLGISFERPSAGTRCIDTQTRTVVKPSLCGSTSGSGDVYLGVSYAWYSGGSGTQVGSRVQGGSAAGSGDDEGSGNGSNGNSSSSGGADDGDGGSSGGGSGSSGGGGGGGGDD
jgi:hypothetical protein